MCRMKAIFAVSACYLPGTLLVAGVHWTWALVFGSALMGGSLLAMAAIANEDRQVMSR